MWLEPRPDLAARRESSRPKQSPPHTTPGFDLSCETGNGDVQGFECRLADCRWNFRDPADGTVSRRAAPVHARVWLTRVLLFAREVGSGQQDLTFLFEAEECCILGLRALRSTVSRSFLPKKTPLGRPGRGW